MWFLKSMSVFHLLLYMSHANYYFYFILSMVKDLIANIQIHNYKIIMLKRHVPPEVIKFYYFLF
jgi:hypothetical protein